MKILKFYADWCALCRVLKTLLNGFDRIPIEDVNVDVNQELTSKYEIRQLPTVVLLDKEGNEVWRKTGLTNPLELENAYHKYRHGDTKN